MAIGIVSDDEFLKESSKISSTEKVVEAVIVDKVSLGRGNNKEVPESLRKIIADEVIVNGRSGALDLAEKFGISPSSVSAYANGATSTATYNEGDEKLTNHINKTKQRIIKKATNRLFYALDGITASKLQEADLKTASSVAKDMAAIVKDMTPVETKQEESKSPTFVFYSPQQRKEESFDVVVVPE
jgi:predicted transcriptional regulator